MSTKEFLEGRIEADELLQGIEGSMKAPSGSSSPTWELYTHKTQSGVFVETGTSGELIPV